jgi:hypothetical protein
MHVFSVLLAATFGVAQTSAHEKQNPLFHELVTKGVAVGPKTFAPLSAPFLADGLDAKGQMAIIKNLVGNQGQLDDVFRDSLVAKHFFKIREIKPSNPEAPAHEMDIWFVAYGDLDRLAKKDLQTIFSVGRKDTKLTLLTKDDLAKRNLRQDNPSHESFMHISYTVFDQVQVSMTTHVMTSQMPDSFIIARRAHPSFTGDAEFPNQWQQLKEDGAGKPVPAGSPVPYEGFAQYMKFTRLAEPKGALFVEYHQVFTEPKGWFNGQNVLRTKLPLLVQTEVRAFRRELKMWSVQK